MNFLRYLYRALRNSRITLNPRSLAELSRYSGISRNQVTVNKDGCLVISGTDVKVNSADRRFLLQGISLVDELRRCSGAVFEVDGNNTVILTVHGVRLAVKDWEELFIAHEVFHRKLYNICLQRPFQVMDVGMNVGTSALFFASMPECERVAGYELFVPTLQRAKENIALNPEFSRKVEFHGYGLGPKDENLVLDYFPELKGSVGRDGLPDYARPKHIELQRRVESVEIRAVIPVLTEFLARAGDSDVVCKIDCEGSEYELIWSLEDSDLLKRISVLLIEWHLRGPQPIKEVLLKKGFNFVSLDEDSSNHGMLYAFNSGY